MDCMCSLLSVFIAHAVLLLQVVCHVLCVVMPLKTGTACLAIRRSAVGMSRYLSHQALRRGCHRYVKGHMKQHYSETNHCIAISFADLSLWCFECESYIDHRVRLFARLTLLSFVLALL